jgi:NADH-quinone oxidoreductase subunit G
MGQPPGTAHRAAFLSAKTAGLDRDYNVPCYSFLFMPKVTIDDQVFEVPAGRTIIQIADDAGIEIPRYCYHPDIGIEASCRMCLVEVEKLPKLVPSCATPAVDGMIVRTNTARVQQAVRYAMEFLLLHHPIDCPVCDQSGECLLQDYYMEHAGHSSRYPGSQKTRRAKAVTLGPLVKLDRERCILCTRCVRFTRNVTKTGEIGVFGRGHVAEIAIHDNKTFDNPYSGNVVDICPVGALTSSDFRFKVRAWFLNGTNSVCAGCSTGCNLRIDHSARALGGGIPGVTATEGTIYRTIGRRNVAVNKSWLCDEGRLSFHTLERWPRLRAARPATNLEEIHRRLEGIRKDHGPASVAALASATSTNEALFLMKKYFGNRVDFRFGMETETFQVQQDDLLRRLDKHPNTHGALDLGLAELNGLNGILGRAERKEIRAMWIAFHPQLVGDDNPDIFSNLERLIAALDYCVVSTTHEFAWASKATVQLPMAAWAEETGTYTNYSGRVQITNRAVAPPGDAMPLLTMMAKVLAYSGVQITMDPAEVFEWMARETPAYANMSYATIDGLGAETLKEVLR